MLFDIIFGHGKDLDGLQMGARAAAVFFLTLLAVRIAGRRSFGQRTPFDAIVAILLGAVISRAVVGASPFVPTIVASLVLVVLHRTLAFLSVLFPRLDAYINGTERLLVSRGIADVAQMRGGLVTPRDVAEAARQNCRRELNGHDTVVLERSGEISVVETTDPR